MKYAAALVFSIISCSILVCEAHASPLVSAVPSYELSANISPDAHHVEVNGTILLPPANESRESVKLVLSDVMKELRVEVLEPRASAGEARLEPHADGEAITWTVFPVHPIPAGEAVRLRFAYQGGEQTRFVFYIGAEGSFAGGNNTAWYPQVERDARAVGVLRFSVTAGFSVFSQGEEISGEPAPSAGARFSF